MASGPVAGDGAREKHMNRKNPKKFRETAIDSELKKRPWQNQAPPVRAAIDDRNSSPFVGAAESDGSSDRSFPLSGRSEAAGGNGLRGYSVFDNSVRIALNSCSKIDIRELKRKLTSELDKVRSLVKKLDATAKDFSGGGGGGAHSQFSSNYAVAAENAEAAVRGSSAAENNGDKRLMKKPKGKKRDGGDRDRDRNRDCGTVMFGQGKDKFSSQLFKSCCNLLEKLMKHKFGWVFNAPVDAKALGLHDYHKIIKSPMDLGTVKARLSKARYKSAVEFAKDVRLTFRNAILYNPKGQDVHSMAEKLLEMFEEKWAVIEANYNLKKKVDEEDDDDVDDGGDEDEANLPRPAPRKVQSFAAPVRTPSMAAPPAMRTLDRSESVTKPLRPESFGRTPGLKKPKAKEPDKRDMTYEEKQRLSTSLQNLPSDKLDNVVQIIKKRNLGLSQQEDEIEVDIASVDPETLWELDRFVTNFKKTLSKNKRKAEQALQSRVEKNVTHKSSKTADSDSEGSSGSGSDSRS